METASVVPSPRVPASSHRREPGCFHSPGLQCSPGFWTWEACPLPHLCRGCARRGSAAPLSPEPGPHPCPPARPPARPLRALPEPHGPQQRAFVPVPLVKRPGPHLGSPGVRWPRPSAQSSATPHRAARAPLAPMAPSPQRAPQLLDAITPHRARPDPAPELRTQPRLYHAPGGERNCYHLDPQRTATQGSRGRRSAGSWGQRDSSVTVPGNAVTAPLCKLPNARHGGTLM